MKKDISRNLVYTTGEALLTVLANRWLSVLSIVRRFNRKPKDYSINNVVVNYAERKIREFQPYQFKDRSYKQIQKQRLSASEPFPLF